MPSNVRWIFSSAVLGLTTFAAASFAQTVVPSPFVPDPNQTVQQPAPTSGDVMRERISKAKAYIVVRNYNAAIYELENLRKETGDPAVRSVVNVLLMNSYLEQGDYKRAQDFLNQFYNEQKTTKAGAADAYASVAGQVVKGARSRAERYKALGLAIGDRTLPLEALNDLEKMRETVELVITQSKEIGKNPARSRDAMALLEEATNSRTMIARDDYDAKRWTNEVADAREEMTSSNGVVMNVLSGQTEAVNNGQLVAANTVPANIPPATSQPQMQPAVQPTMQPVANNTAVDTSTTNSNNAASNSNAPAPIVVVPSAPKEQPKTETVKTDAPASDGPVDVGAELVGYATNKQTPVYPASAKAIRSTGVVKVEVTVNEKGDVAEVHKASGPTLLQSAAKDAIKKWKFKPFTRDGQPVKVTGFVNFNFAL
jgi:TonB family protein